jgi:AraC-like DNA-binding protein
MSEVCLWTTSAAPGKELAYWREVSCAAVFEVEIDAFDAPLPLVGTIQQQQLGAISLSRIDVNFGQIIRRTSGLIACSRKPQLELVYLTDGHLFLRHCGRETELKAGECILVDSREPYELITAPSSRNLSFHLPLTWLQQWLPHTDTCVAKPIASQSGWGHALVAAMRAIPEGSPGELGSLYAEQIAGALTLAVDRSDSSSASVYGRRLLTRLRRTLVDLAHDRSLSASRVASEHRISVRYLHSIFAASGTTYSQELGRIRLERSARMLRDPRFRALSIADIAWQCAFYDASHLSRQFRQQYGCTPGQYRTSQ